MSTETENGDWAITGNPKGTLPKVGTRYQINHTRKGKFTGELLSVDGEWATFLITDGFASAICDYNVRETGERVTCRDTQCRLTEISP